MKLFRAEKVGRHGQLEFTVQSPGKKRITQRELHRAAEGPSQIFTRFWGVCVKSGSEINPLTRPSWPFAVAFACS